MAGSNNWKGKGEYAANARTYARSPPGNKTHSSVQNVCTKWLTQRPIVSTELNAREIGAIINDTFGVGLNIVVKNGGYSRYIKTIKNVNYT